MSAFVATKAGTVQRGYFTVSKIFEIVEIPTAHLNPITERKAFTASLNSLPHKSRSDRTSPPAPAGFSIDGHGAASIDGRFGSGWKPPLYH